MVFTWSPARSATAITCAATSVARPACKRAKEILDEIGLGGERLDMFFMSGSQGNAFAMAAQTMTERIRKLGPNPLKSEARQSRQGNPKRMQIAAEEEDEIDFRGRRSQRDQV